MPAPNKRQTSKLEITRTSLYESGKAFTCAEMAEELGKSSQKVSAYLCAMREKGLLEREGSNTFKKPTKHFINRIRLANPVEAE